MIIMVTTKANRVLFGAILKSRVMVVFQGSHAQHICWVACTCHIVQGGILLHIVQIAKQITEQRV